jgi:hypothetical protein
MGTSTGVFLDLPPPVKTTDFTQEIVAESGVETLIDMKDISEPSWSPHYMEPCHFLILGPGLLIRPLIQDLRGRITSNSLMITRVT